MHELNDKSARRKIRGGSVEMVAEARGADGGQVQFPKIGKAEAKVRLASAFRYLPVGE